LRRYAFGRFEVRPEERRALEDGVPVALGSRAFDLLMALIEHRDRVMGKDELLALVWPGMVVEENNLTVQVSTLRKLFGAEAISTVPGRGYRFTLVPDEARPPTPSKTLDSGVDLSLPDKPSIAILPFGNISGDPEQEYFADGITEDIITELSRFRSLFVIARNSSFSFKGRSPDVRQVGKELGVRYVLEGSVRKATNRVRVTAQLIDAITGNHLWAEKYDRVLEDIFVLQEELTRNIVAAVAPQVDEGERAKARRSRPANMSAYDLALRASANGHDATMRSDEGLRERALAEARAAIALDPRCGLALEVIAQKQAGYLYMYMASAPDAKARWEEGFAAATRLIELDPASSFGYASAAWLLLLAGRADEALAHARRGHELNPNDVRCMWTLATIELINGQPGRALDHANDALRLSPVDPWKYQFDQIRAGACFLLRRYASGLEYARLAAGAAPNWPLAQMALAMAAVGAGDLASARSALERARAIAPDYVRNRLEGRSFFMRDEDARLTTLAFRIAAGLEDSSAADALR
jgi:TolB-like protein/Flp pilus assembly protein TadD